MSKIPTALSVIALLFLVGLFLKSTQMLVVAIGDALTGADWQHDMEQRQQLYQAMYKYQKL